MNLFNADKLLNSKFKSAKYQRNGQYLTNCPAHNDSEASLSIRVTKDKLLLHCHAGCSYSEVIKAAGIKKSDLFFGDDGKNKTLHSAETAQQCNTVSFNRELDSKSREISASLGCTVAEYAGFKQIPDAFLNDELFLRDSKKWFQKEKIDSVEIRYFDENLELQATRYRISLTGKNKFLWKKGDRLCLYGIWRLPDARESGYIIIVEGESDCHTLWFNGFTAIGVPGAANWKDERDKNSFRGINTVYFVKEPDAGGEKLFESLSSSSICDRLKIIELGETKDPSNLYKKNPKAFKRKFQEHLDKAPSLREYVSEIEAEKKETSWKSCESIARKENVLDLLVSILPAMSIAGEENLCKFVYLALTTRFSDRPVSLTVKGSSASGKSYTTEKIITTLFPLDAYYILSSMTEKALIYMDESLKHRFLVIREMDGIQGNFAEYIIRSLLSEGKISYSVTEKNPETLQHTTRVIEKEGPTGLILTTTRSDLNPENENRSLTIFTDCSPEQTKKILHALAANETLTEDFKPWVDFQEWLSFNISPVLIPYSKHLAGLTSTCTTRMRRDFSKVLALIEASALIHQVQRDRDKKNRIIATLEDYRIVYNLIKDFISISLRSSVSENIREIVTVVGSMTSASDAKKSVSVTEVSIAVNVHKSTVSRNLTTAAELGYVKNIEMKKGVEAKYILNQPLPEDESILPSPEELKAYLKDNKVHLMNATYTTDQYFYKFTDYIKRNSLTEDEAFRLYMETADQKSRPFENDRENFHLEYGERLVWGNPLNDLDIINGGY